MKTKFFILLFLAVNLTITCMEQQPYNEAMKEFFAAVREGNKLKINCLIYKNPLLKEGLSAAIAFQIAGTIRDREDSRNIVNQLIYCEVNVNEQTETGATPLILASIDGDEVIINMLLREDADVHRKNKDGETALILAAMFNREAAVERLIEADADINAQDRLGRTALMKATVYDHQEVVRTLLAHGADTSITDLDGKTALDIAVEKGRQAIERMLRKA